MIKNFKGKKILVTGADGFIGSHLVEKLVEIGCEVKATSLYNSFGTNGWLDYVENKEFEIVKLDIRDGDNMIRVVKGCDMVFHLAALISIPFSYESPRSYCDTNISGTINVLEACRHNNVEKILITSTSEVYGTALEVPIKETHPKQPQSPYSATKIAADAISSSYYNSFGLPITIVRPFNTYGPRQSLRAIIPTLICQFLNNTPLKTGNLNPTRDFVFVKDTVDGFIEIAKSDKLIGEEVNIATNKEISIKDLIIKISEILQLKNDVITEAERLRPSNSEVYRLLGSAEKIKLNTNWDSQYNIEKGLKETIEWFKENKELPIYKYYNSYNY
ncbi:MAG: NAD-dependent dehydratase [Bacteroidetes bacterium GWE2_29_8]|nr:MAG: NAD-dependent dehydratase [Bacteroidetes bacterium GWE2_29_8]OFY20037.1 MAG: NAD-dependent dehydratase [Bacteroidetes bacterium GWF2_29_10]